MAETTDTILKTYFETGDVPTQAQFVDLIDSKVNKPDLASTDSGKGADLVANVMKVYDVTDYSATGDGVADDTAEVQAAITAAAAAGGGIVWFPAGTYLLSSALEITDVHGITLAGVASFMPDEIDATERKGSILYLADSTNDNMLEIVSSLQERMHIYVRDLTFHGNQGNQNLTTCASGDTGHGIVLTGARNVVIERCKIYQTAGHGINATGTRSNRLWVLNNDIEETGRAGVRLLSAADSIVSGNQIGWSGKAYWTEASTISQGIYLGTSNNLVSNNHVWQTIGYNIYVGGSNLSTIVGNRVDGSTRAGIFVDSSDMVQIQANRVFDCGVTRSYDTSVTPATLQSGIYLNSTTKLCKVDGNMVTAQSKSFGSESYSDEQNYGIYVAGDGNQITNNHALGNLVDGVHIVGDHNEVRANTVENNKSRGIRIAAGSYNLVEGNTSRYNETGIFVEGAAVGNRILRNLLVDSSGSASSTLSANASGGDTTIDVVSAAGWSTGDQLTITCDNGMFQRRIITNIATNTITLHDALYGEGVVATSGNAVEEKVSDNGIKFDDATPTGTILEDNDTSGHTNEVVRSGAVIRESHGGLYTALYDFSVDGGAVSSIDLSTIPDNSTVTKAWYEVLTAPTSSGSATIAISTAQAANEIVTATAYDNAVFATGYHAAIPDGAAGNYTTKTTAERALQLTVGTAALTAGKIRIWYEVVTSE